MNELHIAIFSRAPVPGAAKTRLIPLLGEEGAASVQSQMAWRTLETASAVPGASVSLWCAGDIDHPFLRACASHFNVPRLPQQEGDLGLRMEHCLQAVLATHRKALLIGTDCPAFDVGALQTASLALDAARMVFTPAEDGGYVLVGARRGGLQPSCFNDVAWSTAQVMAQTRQRLREAGWHSGQDWHEMPALWDVDTPVDYLRAQALHDLR
jgi:rSAM/selenodomain-associated transferase 1